MLTKNSSADNKWLFAALAWTIAMAFLCLISFETLPVEIKGGRSDKFVHFVFHFLFTFFWAGYFRRNSATRPRLALIVAASFLFGVVIEVLQELMTSNRHADIYDALANFAGSLSCAFVLKFRQRFAR